MAAEHSQQCMSHTKARVPKRQCEVVIHGTHACSNYARKGETKCSVHGPEVVRQVLQPFLHTMTGKLFDEPGKHREPMTAMLLAEWEAQVEGSKQPIDPIAHWIEDTGVPKLVVVLPKEQAHDIEIGEKIPLQPEDDYANVQMTVDVYKY